MRGEGREGVGTPGDPNPATPLSANLSQSHHENHAPAPPKDEGLFSHILLPDFQTQ